MTRPRHVLVLVSVALFTLALGIAVGGGPLRGPVRTALQSQISAEPETAARARALALQNRELTRSDGFDRGFAEAVSADLLAGRLDGRSVVVLALPGVSAGVAEAVADDVTTAGGSVTASLRVGPELVDPTARPLVDELSQRMLPELDDVDVAEGSSVYTRAGAVAARALLTTEDGGVAMDESARSVFNTLTTARLLRGPQPQQRASTAVVLVPAPAGGGGGGGANTAGRNVILTELVAAMDDAGDGVVVGGPPAAAGRDGVLVAVRTAQATAQEVSTVDATASRAGQVVTVLALAEQAEGTTGHYGTGRGADAFMP